MHFNTIDIIEVSLAAVFLLVALAHLTPRLRHRTVSKMVAKMASRIPDEFELQRTKLQNIAIHVLLIAVLSCAGVYHFIFPFQQYKFAHYYAVGSLLLSGSGVAIVHLLLSLMMWRKIDRRNQSMPL